MCILNCNNGVIPSNSVPEEESFRDLSKLYVAMTRAKRELILSFSMQLSKFLEKSKNHFVLAKWSEYDSNSTIENFELPKSADFGQMDLALLDLTGKEFLYTKKAVGISFELQEKLVEIIPGKQLSVNGKLKAWAKLGDVLQFARLHHPELSRLFGPETYSKFKELFKEFMS